MTREQLEQLEHRAKLSIRLHFRRDWGHGVLDGLAGTEPQSDDPSYEEGWLEGAAASPSSLNHAAKGND